MAKVYGHYRKDVRHLAMVDPYRICRLFKVTDPCIAHAVKKLLAAGARGAKSVDQDVAEAIVTLQRWQDMQAEDAFAQPEEP